MTYKYKTSGTCASSIEIELNEDTTIESIRFNGGCKGNTQGIQALVKGLKAQDVIDRVSGIRCGFKSTSCPDQLAKALTIMLGEK